MKSNALVFDKRDSNVTGEATANLKNDNSKVEMLAHPKDFSPLIRRDSRLQMFREKEPSPIRISPSTLSGAIARGAAAVALGVLLTPLAAIIPLLDPGEGKDSPCAALLNQAQSGSDTNSKRFDRSGAIMYGKLTRPAYGCMLLRMDHDPTAIPGFKSVRQAGPVTLLVGRTIKLQRWSAYFDARLRAKASSLRVGSSGWYSPKPAATRRSEGTPRSTRNLTTEIARAVAKARVGGELRRGDRARVGVPVHAHDPVDLPAGCEAQFPAGYWQAWRAGPCRLPPGSPMRWGTALRTGKRSGRRRCGYPGAIPAPRAGGRRIPSGSAPIPRPCWQGRGSAGVPDRISAPAVLALRLGKIERGGQAVELVA